VFFIIVVVRDVPKEGTLAVGSTRNRVPFSHDSFICVMRQEQQHACTSDGPGSR